MKFTDLYNKLTEDMGYDEDFSREHWESDSYEEDSIDGSEFGQPGSYYTVSIKAITDMINDEDYTGRIKYPDFDKLEVEEFDVFEYDENGNDTRDKEQIESESPELYERLLNYAKNRLQDKWGN